jgi:GTPase
MASPAPPRDPRALADRVLAGDRASLARAITLVESRLDEDRQVAYELLRLLMPRTGGSHRIGVSGPPGVGKSTLIDALGMLLVDRGRSVAVLAVDPSSTVSGGSILGDKSRMARLALHDRAFIRPTPTDLALGGAARRTREAILLCEAAGFDRVLVETVGVGQSEIQTAGMVDTFLVLVQPGAGDELQGMKRGIVELADLLAVNKTDGATAGAAREAAAEYGAALRYAAPRPSGWRPEVAMVSAATGQGLDDLVDRLERHRAAVEASEDRASRRRADLEAWLRELAREILVRNWLAVDRGARVAALAGTVAAGDRGALDAARELL